MRLLFLISTLCAFASAIPQDSQLSLGGSVINSVTGEPVAYALVQVRGLRSANTGRAGAPRADVFFAHALTDASGSFRFEGLNPGGYTLSAQKPQFVPDTTPQALRYVELTSSISDVKLKLSPLSVISGRVIDQSGQPVWQARVVASSVEILDGLRTTTNDRTVTTDERGIFRMWNLSPGRFFLKVSGRAGATFSYVGDLMPQFFGDQGFRPVYYGGGKTLDEATPLEIVPGAEIHAELKVKTEPAYAIRGTLANFDSHGTVHFELLKDGESLPASPATLNAGSGRFEIQSVIPGTYTLRATQGENSADTQVIVTKTDLEGMNLTMSPPVEIQVQTVLVAAAEQPDNGNGPTARRRGTPCHLSLRAADGRSGDDVEQLPGTDQSSVRAEPGRYRVVASCWAAYAKSIMWDTQDLLSDPILTVRAGDTPPPIVITAVEGGGTVRGKLPERRADQHGDVSVLIVPQFAESTGPIERSFPEAGLPSGQTAFRFDNLAPGTYAVYAFVGRQALEYRNPKFLQSLNGGLTIQVEDRSDLEITLPEIQP